MCLAIPAQIVEILDENTAKARVGESDTFLTSSTMLMPEPLKPGDYVIIHAGFCLQKLDPAEAQRSLSMLREIATVLDNEKK